MMQTCSSSLPACLPYEYLRVQYEYEYMQRVSRVTLKSLPFIGSVVSL